MLDPFTVQLEPAAKYQTPATRDPCQTPQDRLGFIGFRVEAFLNPTYFGSGEPHRSFPWTYTRNPLHRTYSLHCSSLFWVNQFYM